MIVETYFSKNVFWVVIIVDVISISIKYFSTRITSNQKKFQRKYGSYNLYDTDNFLTNLLSGYYIFLIICSPDEIIVGTMRCKYNNRFAVVKFT